MTTKITWEILESYLKCRFKGHLKLAGERGDPSDYEIMLAESRERVRLAATHLLLARHKDDEVLRGVAIPPAVLKRGVPLLLDATVEDDQFSVRFDGLQRRAGPSRLGDFHYLPVLFHESERPGREQKALLELLGLVLADLQGKEPGWGLLIHGRGCQVRKVKLGAGARQARRTLQEIREMQRTGTPPRLMLNSHCQVCEFRQRCHAEALAKDDLSLLRGMSEKEIAKCGRRGIFTVTQLSCTFRPRKRGKRHKQPRHPHHHALHALAIRDKKTYVLGTPELPDGPVRIYFDIEGDPERGFEYLLGLIVETAEGEVRHSFWADTPADEPRLFRQFLDVVGRHEDFRLYAYGSYEAAFLRRMIKDSTEQELGERLLARLVNVLSVIHSHVYFPTYSNGLKDIAGFLGFRWTEGGASGIQSMVWRRRWEETGSAALKEKLTTYNLEDCEALKKVSQCLSALCLGQPGSAGAGSHEGYEVSRVEELVSGFSKREWCKAIFAILDFEFVNERAYFDYQRDKVFIRTNSVLRKSQARERRKRGRKTTRPNRTIEISGQECPFCGGTDLVRRPDGRLSRLAFNLHVSRGGAKRWVTRFTTAWHHCARCGKRFLPRDYLRLEEYWHSLKSWAMYKHIVHRMSFSGIAEEIRDCFGLPVTAPVAYSFKGLMARYYEETYKRLLEKIVSGAVLHADETEVHLKRVGKGYVWVFTNLEEVVFLYRKSREGTFLPELLKGFRGVLVSDFYAPYDSLECEQQKCLIHLIRDFNHDIQGNPWDEELKGLASDFGRLLRKVVATIDQYGLKAWHLGKHRREIDRFFRTVSGQAYRSEVAGGYQKRLLKYQDKLFTFIKHDGVPWNNNSAEHAVKHFAHYREGADGVLSEAGLKDYLVLLSIQLTCKYKGVSFLKFLLSRETDVDAFRQNTRRRRPLPAFELYPQGVPSPRPSRVIDWDQWPRRFEDHPLTEEPAGGADA